MKTSEILFTRQRHLADRAGDHYDIRLVIGNRAHSFATRKDLPEPGKSIMLYETSIHTKDYALRKRIVIPPGNYGSGTTTLDFVRKANLVKNEDKGHYVMETTQGERYLLKPISTIKGKKTWLFKNLGEAKKDLEKEAASKKQKFFSRAVEIYDKKPASKKKKLVLKSKLKKPSTKNKYLVKASSLLAGTAAGHLVQNGFTNLALRSKLVAHHLANNFATGYAGKVATGVKDKVINSITGAFAPDISIASRTFNEMGHRLKELAPTMSKRDHVGLRMLTQGRFSDIHKYGLHNRPIMKKVVDILGKKHGIDANSILASGKTKKLEEIWHSKKYPLLSNIASNISKGKVAKKAVEGHASAGFGLGGGAGMVLAEPGSGALSVAKHLASTHVVQNNPIGKKVVNGMEKLFIKNPIKKGWEEGDKYKEGLKSKLYEHIINPTSAHLQRTSAAISSALKTP